jgi:glucosamine-6-phosphate deaminase
MNVAGSLRVQELISQMRITISRDASELGKSAAGTAAEMINRSISNNGEARIVVSTGKSQFEFFQSLVKEKIEWPRVEVFHLDEYIGIPVDHKASFRKYLYERFINLVPVKKFWPVDVAGETGERISAITMEIRKKPVDVGIIGIGVNGHIAFNDPPADFSTKDSYIIVTLDDRCKMQQVDEGWFKTIDEVPARAVSMSVWQIMQCRSIISVVPHKVKAEAVGKTLKEKVNNHVPATILKNHNDWNLFLDKNSVSEIITF